MKIIGIYYKTVYRDDASGYTTFQVSLQENYKYAKDGILLCRGIITPYAKGITLELSGLQMGHIFQVQACTYAIKTEKGMRNMLSFLTEDELTEHQENKIIELCSNDFLNIFKDTSILETALKRSSKKTDTIKKMRKRMKMLLEHEYMTKVLMKYGIELNKIELLYKHKVTFDMLKKNPYKILLFHDVNIYQADQFAYEECKIRPYSTRRLCGFLLDALMKYKEQGHVCMTPKQICRFINYRLKNSIFPNDKINLSILHYCVSISKKNINYHIINGETYLYEETIWKEENTVIEQLKRLNCQSVELLDHIDINEIEKEVGITFNKEQRESFDLLKTSGVKILTGPPGSGKTATIKGLVLAYSKKYPDRKVKFAATTGAAAQVMSRASGHEAETVNKMLNIRPFGDELQGKNQNDPVDADLIICDEVSMLGLKLASHLFQAIKTGATLILVGDEDQLQSVEYGNILQDLLESGCIEVCKLSQIMRQSGLICENAKKVNDGRFDLETDKTFQIFHCSEQEAKRTLLKLLQKENSQVISPVKKGELGVHSLNYSVQKKQNSNNELCLQYRQVNYYKNDVVIMTKTNYNKGYFNGNIGKVIGKTDKGILVQFQNITIELDKEDFHNLMLAYAITAHKSQGNEFDYVHIVLPREPANMLTRRILYTAITRAKKAVYIYEVEDACNFSISNTAEKPRNTLLKERLQSAI